MTQRCKKLLEYVILECVQLAEPVSSSYLIQKYKLDVSSATIRNDLNLLEQEGYLFQPHTSSGRVPTDLGYRYYVNSLMQSGYTLQQYSQVAKRLFVEIEHMHEIHVKLKLMLFELATMAQSTVMGKLDSNIVFEEGVEHLLTNPDLKSVDLIKSAIEDLTSIRRQLDEISTEVKPGNYNLYIGDENPIKEMRRYSTIVGKCKIDEQDGVIVLIGPKSMQYEKNIALIEHIINNFDDIT